jgi:hypothetical protein
VLAELSAGNAVRAELPGGGRLHIERRLPLLCVYRDAPDDAGADQLLGGEPSYMIIPRGEHAARKARKLLRAVVEVLAKEFGSFLLIELWSQPQTDANAIATSANGDAPGDSARFEIIVPATRIPRITTEAMCKSLGREMLPFGGARVVLSAYENVAPSGSKPFLRLRECREWNCFLLGVVVRPEYRDSKTQEINQAVLHSMTRDLHVALEQANFAFVRQRKTLRPAHFHAPGRRSVVKAVLDIDRQLAEIDRAFDLLLQATPVKRGERVGRVSALAVREAACVLLPAVGGGSRVA